MKEERAQGSAPLAIDDGLGSHKCISLGLSPEGDKEDLVAHLREEGGSPHEAKWANVESSPEIAAQVRKFYCTLTLATKMKRQRDDGTASCIRQEDKTD